MNLRLRSLLLAGAATGSALYASAALAVDVEDDRTDPIETATANGGAADDINITATGSVAPTGGTAVTLNSDNAVSNAGEITITDADGATGVRIVGGFVGSFDMTGSIIIDESAERTDDDGDGTPDGPFAQGSGRTGILIEGASPFTGDVRTATTSTIGVIGNDSFGVNALADIDGSLDLRSATTVLGDRSVGANIAGDVTGSVRLRGVTTVIGEDSQGVVVTGDVDGAIVNEGTVSARGFAFSNLSDFQDPLNPSIFGPPPLDEDDLKEGGPAFVIAGNVGEGFLNNGFVGGGAADDDADGNDPVKDISGDFDENRSVGAIQHFGSSPAVLIDPSQTTGGDIVIGLVVERIPDTLDDDDDDDTTEIIGTFLEDYGFINRGGIQAAGLNVGFDASAIVITGAADGRTATVEGGFLNTGTVSATANVANATAVRIGQNAIVPEIVNSGGMTGSVITEEDHQVTVLLIEAGALVSSLENSGSIDAVVRGDAGNTIAIRDLSGTLLSINNTGSIRARFVPDGDDDDGDGFINDLDERTGLTVAVDLSNHSAAQSVIFVQDFDADDDPEITLDDPRITGDVLFGAGDDDFQLLAGTMTGDVSFGGGADIFTVDGGAVFTGALRDSDGALDVSVTDGELNITNQEVITVTSLTLGDTSLISMPVDLRSGGSSALIDADGPITIADGARILPQIVGLGPSGEVDVNIMSTSGGLTVAGDIADALAAESPFLFDASLSTATSGADETVVVTVRRRTAEELGMSANQAAAYEPVVQALNSDTELLVATANIAEANDFFEAYNQLLPEYSQATFQFFVAASDGAIGAVGNRLDTVRGGRQGAGSAWMQEYGVYLDREAGANDPGYRGDSFGVAIGLDRPLGPFYAVGLNLSGGAASIEQPYGFDAPLSVTSAQVGAYAAAAAGNLLLDFYAGGGADYFESERRVFISDLTRTTTADWKGHHATASARVAYEINRGRWYGRPALSVDYLRLDEEPYREAGGGAAVDLALDERSADMLASTVSMTLGANLGNDQRTWWSPRFRVGYRYENFGSAQLTTARFVSGMDPLLLRADELPNAGAILGFSLAAGSQHSSFSLDYDGDIRDGFARHGMRVTFRFIF